MTSKDSIWFNNPNKTYYAGDTITVISSTADYSFSYVITTDSLVPTDSLRVQDVVQSMFFIGCSDGVWMTRKALDFSETPEWYKIATNNPAQANPDVFTGTSQCMAYSQCGNYLFVGTSSGSLYRISNLLLADDAISADVSSAFCVIETKNIKTWSNRTITSIAVDPNDAEHIAVTLGNYGQTDYIYRSTDALSANPNFESRQGTLLKMPLYTSIIEMNNSDKVIIGSEHGVFSTDDFSSATPTWASENTNGLANVPVYFLTQQTKNFPEVTNWGAIYAGTHGRGIFESNTFLVVGIDDDDKPISTTSNKLTIYPNPVKDNTSIVYQLFDKTDVQIDIYNTMGQLVKSYNLNNQQAGSHKFDINCSDLNKGIYIVNLTTKKGKTNGKFIVL